jgi:hypothetical protein
MTPTTELRDLRQPTTQGGDRQAPGVVDQIQRGRLRRGREPPRPRALTPAAEAAQIRLVGPARCSRPSSLCVPASALAPLDQRRDLSPTRFNHRRHEYHALILQRARRALLCAGHRVDGGIGRMRRTAVSRGMSSTPRHNGTGQNRSESDIPQVSTR